MAYDEEFADRVREVLGGDPNLTEKRMFGGLAWMDRGNMAVVARGEGGLMVRVGPDDYPDMLEEEGAEPTIMKGSAMKGWITVSAADCADEASLRTWVARGLNFAQTLPPK